jgi:hypothetical protein
MSKTVVLLAISFLILSVHSADEVNTQAAAAAPA